MICDHGHIHILSVRVRVPAAQSQRVFAGKHPVFLVTIPCDIGYCFLLLRCACQIESRKSHPNSDAHAGENKKKEVCHPSFLPCTDILKNVCGLAEALLELPGSSQSRSAVGVVSGRQLVICCLRLLKLSSACGLVGRFIGVGL